MAKAGKPAFSVKIYDKKMDEEIAYKILVSTSAEYGRPTDIRVASDGQYLYAFYETVRMDIGKAYLWGAKYTLNDNFGRIAYTSSPIAEGPIFTQARSGDELVNDPIPLIDPNSVFVITRIKQESFSKKESMIYRVRELLKIYKRSFLNLILIYLAWLVGAPDKPAQFTIKATIIWWCQPQQKMGIITLI